MAKNRIPVNIFRGYDIRGVVDKEIDGKMMSILAKAYATFLFGLRINEAVVGCDNRLSSPRLKKSFIMSLLASGINVIDIGYTLSQILYFAQYYYQAKGAAIISASHNPKEYNGLKLAVSFSNTMLSEEIQEIRKIASSGKFKKLKKKGLLKKEDVYPAYEKDILKKMPIKKKFKVVIDGCNTTVGLFIPRLLRASGCKVAEYHTNLDGNFPLGTPDPTERKVQERLASEVLKEKADVGFSFDADGDRLGVVDEKGDLIWNDTLVAIFAKDVLDYLPYSKIIYNALCSKQVTEAIIKSKGMPIMWKVGHSFIKAKVREERAPFGGELSGHFFFMDNFYGHDDSAIASLRILSYLERHKKTLSQVVRALPQYISSPEIKLGCPDEIKFDFVNNQITKEFKEAFPNAKFTTIDGIRMDTKEEMAIIRASQNGPYLTIKFEAKKQGQYDLLKKTLYKILKKYKQVDFSYGVNLSAFK